MEQGMINPHQYAHQHNYDGSNYNPQQNSSNHGGSNYNPQQNRGDNRNHSYFMDLIDDNNF